MLAGNFSSNWSRYVENIISSFFHLFFIPFSFIFFSFFFFFLFRFSISSFFFFSYLFTCSLPFCQFLRAGCIFRPETISHVTVKHVVLFIFVVAHACAVLHRVARSFSPLPVETIFFDEILSVSTQPGR